MAAYMRYLRDHALIARSAPPLELSLSNITADITNNSFISSIGMLNTNHLSYDKWKDMKLLIQQFDIFFMMETWTMPPDIPGYNLFVDSSVYFNSLYVKSNLDANVTVTDFGFKLGFPNPIYCLYIPPGQNLFKLPEGTVIGDLNWRSNRFAEPEFHEIARSGYTGTSSKGIKAEFQDIPWSDHMLGKIIIDEKTNMPSEIDKNRTIPELINASFSGNFKPKTKVPNRKLVCRNMNFRARLYTTDCKKIYNSDILTENSLKPWMEIFKHNPNKKKKQFKSLINISKCSKLTTKAKDELGLNANMILALWKNWSLMRKVNVITALRSHTNIKGLLLKKKEFAEASFNIKNFRIICIMPTFIKLVESTLDFNLLDHTLHPAFIGFRPGRSVENVIAYLTSAVT